MSAGDRMAVVAAALRDNGPRLRRFVAGRVPACDVDDVIQIAALRAMEKADTLNKAGRALPWLYRIHASVAVDLARKRASEQRLKDAVVAEVAREPDDTEGELCGCTVAQAKRLRPRYTEILHLVDVEGEPLGDAAQTLGISVGNAGVRLHRARQALRRKMEAHCGITSVREGAGCRCVSEGRCPA